MVGVAHRGVAGAVGEFAEATGSTYPLAIGTDVDWVRTWARGDRLYIVGKDGMVAYSQYGFREQDPEVWKKVLADLRAGRAASITEATRKELQVGDVLPTIDMPELTGDKVIRLSPESGHLVYRDAKGQERSFKASVGFFSRY